MHPTLRAPISLPHIHLIQHLFQEKKMNKSALAIFCYQVSMQSSETERVPLNHQQKGDFYFSNIDFLVGLCISLDGSCLVEILPVIYLVSSSTAPVLIYELKRHHLKKG